MSSAVNVTNNLTIDFRRDNSAEQRPYFVIGAINGAQNAIADLAKQYQGLKLEVLQINPGYRNALNLPANFQGIAVFVQDHNQNDADHTQGTHTGSNIFQTFNTIQRVKLLPVENHAKTELQAVQGQRLELGEIADEVMPQYKQLDQLIAALFKATVPVHKNDVEVAKQLNSANAPVIAQIREQMASLNYMLENGFIQRPEFNAQKADLERQLKLAQF